MAELSTLGHVIKLAYEGQADTNAFTDAEKAKLSSMEEAATANASDADLRDRSTHTGTQFAASIVDLPDLLAGKVDVAEGKGLSDANFTAAEKMKLASLEDAHFKGVYVGLSGLTTAHPTAEAGDYAVVDDGVDLTWYQWDVGAGEWVARAGESTEVTPSQVKSYYESNPDTNAFTDDEKARLAQLGGTGRFTLRRVGTWNAATNTPELIDGTGNAGDYYVVTTGGTQNFGSGSYNFSQYDWVLYTGGTWQRFAANPPALAWDNISGKPAVYIHRGSISPPIPALYAANSAGVLVPTNTATDYPLTESNFDTFSIMSDGKIVIPSWANRFRLTASINFEANPNGRRQASVFINGGNSTTLRVMAVPDALTSVPLITPIRPVNPGDVLELRVYHTAGVNLNVSNTSWVQVELFEDLA